MPFFQCVLDKGYTSILRQGLFSKMKKEMFYGHKKDFHDFVEVQKAIDEYVR